MRRTLLAILLAGLACSSRGATAPKGAERLLLTAPDGGAADGGRPIPTVTGPERMISDHYYVLAGAPDPLACQLDRDCIGDTVTDSTGCCVRTPDSYPQTWAWHTWLTQRRLSQDCDKVTCEPLPVSGMPKACHLDVKCLAGRCVDSCSEEPHDEQDGGQKQAPKKQ